MPHEGHCGAELITSLRQQERRCRYHKPLLDRMRLTYLLYQFQRRVEREIQEKAQSRDTQLDNAVDNIDPVSLNLLAGDVLARAGRQIKLPSMEGAGNCAILHPTTCEWSLLVRAGRRHGEDLLVVFEEANAGAINSNLFSADVG